MPAKRLSLYDEESIKIDKRDSYEALVEAAWSLALAGYHRKFESFASFLDHIFWKLETKPASMRRWELAKLVLAEAPDVVKLSHCADEVTAVARSAAPRSPSDAAHDTFLAEVVLKLGFLTTFGVSLQAPNGPSMDKSFVEKCLHSIEVNGRHIEYAVVNSTRVQETGEPVLLFYPLGASRSIVAVFHGPAKRVGVRLVCINRPGMGQASPTHVGSHIEVHCQDVVSCYDLREGRTSRNFMEFIAWQCPRSAFRYDLMFFWMTSTMSRAKGKKVELSDLPMLPSSDAIASMTLQETLRSVAAKEVMTLVYAAIAMFLYAVSMCMMPVAMMMVIKCAEVEETSDFNWLDPAWSRQEAMLWWIIIYVVLQAISAVANHWQAHMSYHAGQRMRAQESSESRSSDKATAGAAGANCVTFDLTERSNGSSRKFLEALPFLHKLWASPLQVLLASIILLALVDVSALFGIAVLVLVVPLSRHFAKLLGRFRSKHLIFQDQRVRMCVELLEGIRCIKFFAWEKPYLQRVFEKRAHEIHWALRESLIFGLSMIIAVLTPMLAFTATLVAFVLQDTMGDESRWTPTRIFGTLALLNALRFPIMDLGTMLATIVSLYTSWHRLCHFFRSSEAAVPDNVELALSYCSFSCKEGTKDIFRLKMDIDLKVRPGELVVILGKVGSGKSTLLQGILGEVCRTRGTAGVRGRIAYCSQQPWIRNDRAARFGEDWYTQVLEACGLAMDLQQLSHGDLTEIGERGITLSGGPSDGSMDKEWRNVVSVEVEFISIYGNSAQFSQKQRVALARAVYHRSCSLVLLDDVLSALDAHTSRHILQALIGPAGLLKDRAVLLATHNTAAAERAQRVLLLGSTEGPTDAEKTTESSLLFDGPWQKLCEEKALLELIGQANVEAGEGGEGQETVQESLDLQKLQVSKPEVGMMKAEDHSGSISRRSISIYLRCCGGWPAVAIFCLSSVLERVLTFVLWIVGMDWWLSRWTTQVTAEEAEMEIHEYLGVYLGILGCATIFISVRISIAVFTIRGGQKLFERLALRVVRAPMRWWDTTPLGRVLNRFSFDTDNVDTTLVTKLFMSIMSLSWCAGAIGVFVGTFWPWSLIFIPIPTTIYFWLFQFSRKSIRQFQQLDSISRSPIQSVYSEVLSGIVSVRAFGCEAKYRERLARVIDVNSAAILTFNSSNRWLGVRVELLAAFISSLIGLGFWNLATSLGFNCIFSSQAEACFTSVDRMTEYAVDVPEEGEHQDLDGAARSDIKESTTKSDILLSFEKVCLRYQPGLPLALDSVSFQLERKERLAVVGRTGSGKSTLAEGQVILQGQNLADLPLDMARRSMGIITQDPVIFSGTVHYNLDPFNDFDAATLVRLMAHVCLCGASSKVEIVADPDFGRCSEALQRAQLAETLQLETQIDQAGVNLSVGERQLLCLARALLRSPRLLVCDEATSSVDAKTDSAVQRCLREAVASFDVSLLTIAHRLVTIADYDKVMLLEAGRMKEFDSPRSDGCLDHLGIHRVRLLFLCAGAPFALGFQARYPHRSHGRLVGCSSWVSPSDCPSAKFMYQVGAGLPSRVLASLADAMVGWTRSMPSSSSGYSNWAFTSFLPSSSMPLSQPAEVKVVPVLEQKAYADSQAEVDTLMERCASLMLMEQETGGEGPDAATLVESAKAWGVDYRRLGCSMVLLHGDADATVPVDCAEWLQAMAETQVFICSLSSSWFQTNCVATEHLSLYVAMFEPMFETISGWFSYVAESVPLLQGPKEPLETQDKFSKDDMEGLLSFLKLPMSYGHEEFKQHWPHTPHEANLVVQSLHDLARALLFGAREEVAIVTSFLQRKGLIMLVEALLAVSTPEIIRAQAWQSLCENRMNFVSCLKSVCMRINVETLPFLMTEDKDIPLLRMAMAYTAHEEALLRTQARSAMLTLFGKMKMGEGQLLRTALEMAKSRNLGSVLTRHDISHDMLCPCTGFGKA
eukprot:s185_g39.t1